ncbi:MAG: hydroxymethylglutaryl-CoA lyase, partial [Rhodocyclaceae bacterium]|nr:hydroxymethylglutaryl-CoA lyase [Rhodocyclaceae bacterium]
ISSGVDLARLLDCAAWISAVLGRRPASRVGQARCAAMA